MMTDISSTLDSFTDFNSFSFYFSKKVSLRNVILIKFVDYSFEIVGQLISYSQSDSSF